MVRIFSHPLLVLFLLISLLMAATVGVFVIGTMGNEPMPDCPYMGSPALCDMGPLQHLAQWQTLFAAIVPQIVLLLSVAVMGLFLFYVQTAAPPHRRGRGSERARDIVRLYDPWQSALSEGILHPKIF